MQNTVTIYQDPLSRQNPEGEAKLLKKLSTPETEGVYDGCPVERWLVKFKGERPVERYILGSGGLQ